MKVNIHIYPSPFNNESRMLRETKSIVEFGLVDKIIIVALWSEGKQFYEQIDEQRSVVRIKLFFSRFQKNIITELLKQAEFILKIIFKFYPSQNKIVNIHSLHILPLAFFFKVFFRKKIIYDAHELETEVNGAVGVKKKIAKLTERIFMPFIDRVIVVSDSIEKWYKQTYPSKQVYTVKNIADYTKLPTEKSNLLRNYLGLKQSDIIFIYQGVLAEWRGVRILITSFIQQNGNKHLVLMGMGQMENEAMLIAKEHSNIHFVPAVKPAEIVDYTSDADVGISLIMNTCLSYYYCLPNKVFEYIFSGLPIVVSKFPDMTELVNSYDLGWAIDPNQVAFDAFIETFDNDTYLKKKENVIKHRSNFSWKKEAEQYKLIYAGY